MLANITVYKHWAISFLGVCAAREIGAQTPQKQMVQCLYMVIVASMRHRAKVFCLQIKAITKPCACFYLQAVSGVFVLKT